MFGRVTLDMTHEEFMGLQELIHNAVEQLPHESGRVYGPGLGANQDLSSVKVDSVH